MPQHGCSSKRAEREKPVAETTEDMIPLTSVEPERLVGATCWGQGTGTGMTAKGCRLCFMGDGCTPGPHKKPLNCTHSVDRSYGMPVASR